jgi:hypothetical protein
MVPHLVAICQIYVAFKKNLRRPLASYIYVFVRWIADPICPLDRRSEGPPSNEDEDEHLRRHRGPWLVRGGHHALPPGHQVVMTKIDVQVMPLVAR